MTTNRSRKPNQVPSPGPTRTSLPAAPVAEPSAVCSRISGHAEVGQLASTLGEDWLIEHKSKDVRLLAACALADILRLYAPEPPYSDECSADIIRLFIKIIRGFESPDMTTNHPSYRHIRPSANRKPPHTPAPHGAALPATSGAHAPPLSGDMAVRQDSLLPSGAPLQHLHLLNHPGTPPLPGGAHARADQRFLCGLPPPPPPLAQSSWAHQSAPPGRFPAPRLTDL